jgi:DNA ligase-associated metallophosphoesterase
MTPTEYIISFGNEELMLTDQRAIYWPAENTLILSDLHLGKAAHFRKHGIPLPTTVNERDLFRLQNLLSHNRPRHLIIVGDLIHAGNNKEVLSFRNLTAQHPKTQITLIKGNHDRHTSKQLAELGIATCLDSLQFKHIYFSHLPQCGCVATISGHIHPGVEIHLPYKKYMRLPCYVVTDNQLILPAFSLFTGLDTYAVPQGATCYAIFKEHILAIAKP